MPWARWLLALVVPGGEGLRGTVSGGLVTVEDGPVPGPLLNDRQVTGGGGRGWRR
ncbi:hypothetical protein [Nonomuraea lactucae]|uniref:hypothetical protein n=1 Tax=Nonomuraea lactucae TaxID=2249762 RepID=UPI0013B3C930|nr:hypothetical protein [Nonomuraea lactucae]